MTYFILDAKSLADVLANLANRPRLKEDMARATYPVSLNGRVQNMCIMIIPITWKCFVLNMKIKVNFFTCVIKQNDEGVS